MTKVAGTPTSPSSEFCGLTMEPKAEKHGRRAIEGLIGDVIYIEERQAYHLLMKVEMAHRVRSGWR